VPDVEGRETAQNVHAEHITIVNFRPPDAGLTLRRRLRESGTAPGSSLEAAGNTQPRWLSVSLVCSKMGFTAVTYVDGMVEALELEEGEAPGRPGAVPGNRAPEDGR